MTNKTTTFHYAGVTSEYEPFTPGEEVILTIAGGERRAVVLEDRGLIGHAGQHILAVTTDDGDPDGRFETFASIARRVVPA